MTQQIINTGVADKGNGDPIRTAFTKVNANFAELYNQLAASVVVGAAAPTGPEEGSLWWNSESGRMYVYYGTAWVDASPVDGAGISSTNQLVNGAYTVSLGANGVLTLPDGSIINGSTIRGVAGTGELNYTGITIGPNSNDAEKTWMWVDHANAYISTNNAANTWTFGNNGSLTFPDTTAQTTAWTGSVSSLVNGANTVSLDNGGLDLTFTSGEKIKTIFGGGIELYRSGDNTIGIYTGGAEIKTFATGGAKHTWTFGTNGKLTFPNGAGFGLGETGQLKVDDSATVSLDLRDTSGRGFYTNSDGYTLRSNGTYNWAFGADGSLTLPLGSTLGETLAATTVTIYGAGVTVFNQTYTRTYGDPTYPDQYLGSNNCRIFRDSGTANKWRLREVSTDYYESDDLVTWTDFIGGADPAPTGIVSLKTADITVGTNTWKFNTNGGLTFPDGKSSIYTLDPATSGGINGIVMNGKDRAYIGIENEAFGYGWDFRAFGLADYSTTLKPAIKFPGSGWLQEDFTDIMNENVPLQLGSQGSITLTATGVVPPTAYNWVFGRDGSLTFPDNTVQTTAYLGITNKAGPSATIAVGSIMTRNDLSVRVTNNSNTLDLEIKYSSPDGQRLVSAYKSYPSVSNIYSGRTLKAANNTTWDLVGNLPLEGDSLGFTFTDHSMLKVYRVTVVADIMPGGGGGGALGEVFCTIEELK